MRWALVVVLLLACGPSPEPPLDAGRDAPPLDAPRPDAPRDGGTDAPPPCVAPLVRIEGTPMAWDAPLADATEATWSADGLALVRIGADGESVQAVVAELPVFGDGPTVPEALAENEAGDVLSVHVQREPAGPSPAWLTVHDATGALVSGPLTAPSIFSWAVGAATASGWSVVFVTAAGLHVAWMTRIDVASDGALTETSFTLERAVHSGSVYVDGAWRVVVRDVENAIYVVTLGETEAVEVPIEAAVYGRYPPRVFSRPGHPYAWRLASPYGASGAEIPMLERIDLRTAAIEARALEPSLDIPASYLADGILEDDGTVALLVHRGRFEGGYAIELLRFDLDAGLRQIVPIALVPERPTWAEAAIHEGGYYVRWDDSLDEVVHCEAP